MKQIESLLDVQKLDIGYKNKTLTQNLCFSLKKGTLTALVGSNGVGKSTLIKTLIGFQKPLMGSIYLKGKELNNLSPKEIAQNISIVLTEKLPPSNLTAYQIIALGRQPYTNWIGKLSEADKAAIDRAISLLDISHITSMSHNRLSDGQLQKVMIARAIAQETDIIILDEPTTHLDLIHKIGVYKLLKELSAESEKTILFSTHDIELALEFCDQVIIINSEQNFCDTPENLIKSKTIDLVFNHGNIHFDKATKRFIFSS